MTFSPDHVKLNEYVIIRPAKAIDMYYFWSNMRHEDMAEFTDNGLTFDDFMAHYTEESVVFEVQEKPVAFLGKKVKREVMWIYLFGTPTILEIKKVFHKTAKLMVSALRWEMVKGRRVMTLTDSKYCKAIRWLKALGFEQVGSRGDFNIMELK